MFRRDVARNGQGAEARGELALEPLGPEHAAATFRWVSEPEVARNLGLRNVPSLVRTESWIAAARDNESVRAFAILRDAVHIGNVVLDQMDRYLGNARLSIYIGEARARGSGAGRAALELVLAEAFGPLDLHKVWLVVHPGNAAAIRLYVATGFLLEGILRDEFLLDGERVSAIRMGILRSEFPTPRRRGA